MLEKTLEKLKLQSFGYLMQRADSLEKNLMLGKTEGKRRRGRQRMRCLDSISDSMHMNPSKLGGGKDRIPGVLQTMGSLIVGHDFATEQHNQVFTIEATNDSSGFKIAMGGIPWPSSG